MSRLKKEIQADIDKITKALASSATPDGAKPKLKVKLEALQAALETASDKPKAVFKTSAEKKKTEGKKVKKEKPAKAEKKAQGNKQSEEELKKIINSSSVAPSEKKKAAKKLAKKVNTKSKKPAANDDDELEDSITIGGVTISKKDCPDGYEAFLEAKNNKAKSAEKSEKKPSIEKAHHSFYTGIGQIFDSVAQSKIEGDPAQVKKALKGFKTDIARGFDRLTGIT